MINKVVVITGGDSAERPVSLSTAESVAKALETLKIKCSVILAEGGFYQSVLDESPDVVFIAMHGGRGEDGSIQGMLEVMGLPYTGSGVLSSAICMNKIVSKNIFEYHGLNVPAWQRLESPRDLRLPFPVVIKPVCGGSTIATSIVRDPGQAAEAFEKARSEAAGGVMAEEYIPGKEVTVSILGGRALPVLEIISESGFYDYEAKYTGGGSRHILLEDDPKGVCSRLRDSAETAFRAAMCSTYGRVDFRLDGERCCILEINTIPGMTKTSLLPEAAAHAGIGFESLALKILEDAKTKKHY